MSPPEPLLVDVEKSLGSGIDSVTLLGGGCISHSARLQTEDGNSWFLKWNAADPASELFAAEADGLSALGHVGAVRVPSFVARGGGDAVPAWLLLEYVPPQPPGAASDHRLGLALAEIHAYPDTSAFGWARDNWIGSLPQPNGRLESWGAFWRERRLLPQLLAAREHDQLGDDVFDRLVELTEDALADVERPELLHGDLWSGNAYTTSGDLPVLVDPAVYLGDGEVDLAMTELFGGFGRAFYDAYREAHGISDAYGAYRRDLYQLYYLLVHVNLFGSSYVAATLRAAERVLAAWR